MSEIAVKVSRANLSGVGRKLVPLAEKAAKADLGVDGGFSGWRRGRVIQLQARANPSSNGSSLTVRPTRDSAGPFRVAETGRNRGEVGTFLGPGATRTGGSVRTKTGKVRKTRARQAKRWNGVTAGKSTWSDAEALMEPIAVQELQRLYVSTVDDEFGRPL